MVKAMVGDETQLQLAEDRLSRSSVPAQVGLVIGKLSRSLDRGFVFDLVATPANDAGQPACSLVEAAKDDKRKGPKSKSKSQASDSSSLLIDNDWVAEHARQVSRMLVGGMNVIGIYVWSSEVAFKNSIMVLCETLKGVAEAASVLEADIDESLLIHISYSPRRWACRNCALSSNISASSLRPCDFKMGRVLNSIQTFRCLYNFDFRLPIYRQSASNSQTLSDILRHGISVHSKELRGAKALIDGSLVNSDESSTTDGLHEVELLLPFMKDAYSEACSQEDVTGVIVFTGSISSYAYLNSKESISQAVADIKGDIIRSLQSRLDIICDDADEDEGPSPDESMEARNETSSKRPVSQLLVHSMGKTCSLSFPRRVFVPWLAGTFISDYLQPSETLEVLKDHCVELMSMEAPTNTSTILEPEEEAPGMIAGSFWDALVPSASSLENSREKTIVQNSQKPAKSTNINFVVAVFFLILSFLVGYMLVGRRS